MYKVNAVLIDKDGEYPYADECSGILVTPACNVILTNKEKSKEIVFSPKAWKEIVLTLEGHDEDEWKPPIALHVDNNRSILTTDYSIAQESGVVKAETKNSDDEVIALYFLNPAYYDFIEVIL